MAQVDPFVIPIPRALLADPEVRFYHEYLNKFLHDLWIRTGGGNDEIADQSLRELYPWQALTDEEPESVFGLFGNVTRETLEDNLTSLYSIPQFPTDKGILSTSVDYTTAGNQIIICTNTAGITITLNPNPEDGEEVHIKRKGTGLVAVSGGVDGVSSFNIRRIYDSPNLIYTVDAGEWSVI